MQKQKNNPSKVNKLTADQRLKAMEGLLAQHHSKFEILADEIDKVSNLLVTLNKKVNAILEAGDAGQINKDSVSGILLDKAVNELKNKVTELVNLKAIESRKDGLIEDERHFVVSRELDADGNVVNPRTQFAVISLPEDLRSQFVGKKVGDLIKSDDSDVSVEIMEVYKLADLNKKVEVKAEENEEESEEAPAEEEASESKQ